MFTRSSLGEAFIMASIQVLLDRLASPAVFRYLRGKKPPDLGSLLRKMRLMVSSVAVALGDAEERQLRSDPDVEAWLDGAQAALFDAEDLLDEIATDALRLEAEAESDNEVREPKRRKISFGLFSRSGDSGVESRVQRVIEQLEAISEQKEILGLRDRVLETMPWRRLPSTSLVDEGEVYGRDGDKGELIELLFDENVGGGEKVNVVPIVGMAGVGKTTLAQAVFNDRRVKARFQVRLWVCVSEEFDACRVARALLDSDSSCSDLNSLQVELKEKLSGEKFLIVLDDVWNESYLDWDVLRQPFKAGARGSKIIVSTRSNKVASIMGTVPSHQLKELPDEACWKLFVLHASGFGDFTANPELDRIGREIVAKCKGLPLAVKTLGGVLRSTFGVGEWERVARSELWELKDVRSQILPALRLSYHYLPSRLKQCFSFCSIFPKDYRFDKEELILLWMAENLLVDPSRAKSMEEVGDEYFDDLVSRSFLQQSGYANNRPFFVMHDLLVDLAKSVSKKYCFLSETSGSFNEVSITQARHFAFVPKEHYPYERFASVFKATHLRTFLPVKSMFSCMNLSSEVIGDLFSKLRCLRALSLSGYNNVLQLPNTLGDLLHLRYLNLSSTSISILPESTITLYNLQTLKLAFCGRLSELPKDLHRLVNLRHLDITSSGVKELPESLSRLSNLRTLMLSRCRLIKKLPEEFHRLVNLRKLEVSGTGLEAMPARIRELRSLETLNTFVVGKDLGGAEIGELGGLSNLRGTLHIKNLQNVVKPEEASEARLSEKKYLDGLQLEWDKSSGTASKQEIDVVDSLLPNTSLKKLEFICYRGTEFPNWLGDRSFTSIVDMSLLNCSHCSRLPPLGELPSLKNLQIKRVRSLVSIGSEFYGSGSKTVKPFASLEVLEIHQLPKWEVWSASDRDSEAFPKLRKLTIQSCGSLKKDLPRFLPSLTDLTISDCDQLVPPLPAMPSISKLELKMCENLRSVVKPSVLEPFNQLQHLEVSANSLSIRLKCLPLGLKTLKIQSYSRLEFEVQQPASSLEELSLECSDEGSFRAAFVLDSFPGIRKLCIGGCQNVESLWPSSSSSQSYNSLSTLEISNCPDSTLFPKNSPPFSNLTSLVVRRCKKLKHLSEHLGTLLPSLESLVVNGCSAMETFSKSGLPHTVCRLLIESCDVLMSSRMDWNLHRLARLKELTIGGCECDDMESFPEEGLLPSGIAELNIWYLECLETLNSEGLRQLTSLKQLLLFDCPNLATMEGSALPDSLESLRIKGCPLLQGKCRKTTGEYWDKISHVPYIYIEYKLVS